MQNNLLFKAAAQWLWLLLSRIICIILGYVIVAIAIPFRKDGVSKSDGRYISNLPKWAWLWGNDNDGLLGDKRLWWSENTPFGLPVDHFVSMYWWTAIRNPANNMRQLDIFSAPVTGSRITYLGDYTVNDNGKDFGKQLVIIKNNGKTWYGYYLVKKLSESRAFVIRLGFKVKPSHNGLVDEPRKGMVFKINFFKKL